MMTESESAGRIFMQFYNAGKAVIRFAYLLKIE